MIDLLLLMLAALAAGAINALAGGGSFITLPALIFYGLPPTVANATSATAVLPGYAATLWRLKADVAPPAGIALPVMIVLAAAGGISGALLLLATGDALFSAIVPWLMLVALGVFVAGPWLKKATARITISRWVAVPAVYLTCVYGGYFNGGVGIIMIAVLGLLGQTRLLTSVAMKAVMSATLTLISVSTYAAFGLVQWPIAGLMALGAITGGWGGAALGHVIAPKWHRAGIIVIAAAMTLALFMRGAG